MIIQELAYKITLQADEFLNGKRKVTRGVEDLDKETKTPLARIKKGFGEAADSASEFGEQGKNAFTKVHSGLAQFLGVAITLEAFRRGFLSTTKTLVDLGNTSSFLDMGTKSLEGFNRAAAATGSSEQSMTSMLMRLKNAKNWQEFPMGAPDATTIATQQLQGMTGVDIMGGKDPGDMLLKTASALRKLNKQQAQVMWGNMGGQSDMFNLMYSEPMDKLVSKYTKGSNATDAAVKQARDVNKVLQDLNQTVSNLGYDMVLAFGPTVNEGLKQFSDWIANNKDDILGFFKEGAEWAKKFSDAVGGPTNAAILLLGMKGGKTTALAAMALIAGKTLADPEKAHEVGEKLQGGADVINGALGLDSPMAPLEKIRSIDINDEEQRAILMDALAMQESSGNRYAVSKAGAKGLYQLMIPAAREMGLTVNDQIDERLDPEKSRGAAEGYLLKQFNRFGNLEDALRAYHDGPENVAKWIAGGRKETTGRTLSQYGARYPLDVGEHLGKKLELSARSNQAPDAMAEAIKFREEIAENGGDVGKAISVRLKNDDDFNNYRTQASEASRPVTAAPGPVDNSQTNSVNMPIQNVTVVANSPDQLGRQLADLSRRSQAIQAFASGNK